MDRVPECADPVEVLGACIAAARDSLLQSEEGDVAERLEQCLRLVRESLREKDGEIERLKRALEKSESESGESAANNSVDRLRRGSEACAGRGDGGAISVTVEERAVSCPLDPSLFQDTEGVIIAGGREVEPMHGRMTEPDSEERTRSIPCCASDAVEQKCVQPLNEFESKSNAPEPASDGMKEQESAQTSTEAGFLGTEEEAGAKGFGKTDASVGEVVVGSEQEGALVGVGRGEEREVGEEGMETEGVCSDTQSNGSSLWTAGEGQPGTEGAVAMAMDESEGYQKVEFAVLYYHSTTGYYYDPGTQQFLAPAPSGYQQTAQSNPETGQPVVQTEQSSSTGNTEQASSLTAAALTACTGTESGQTGLEAGQTSSVADMLAAVSDQASQKCGYVYDESSGMYYDHRYAMYYDQESQLYYDPEYGTYYEYDTETRQYQFHSRVKLPSKRPCSKQEDETETVVDLCNSSEDEAEEDSLEEGEIRYPKYPQGSPPPEDEWAPCLRLVVGSSECVPRGSVYVVTQEGAELGREPGSSNPVTLHEVQVSKCHVVIRYSKTKKCFTVIDLGSQNGTLLNQERLSEPKQRSKPRPLTHCDTLAIGTTTFTLHIHTGWDTCEWCRWEERGGGGGGGGGGGEVKGPEGKAQWKKELNRIKKRYGLRMKDTYGEDPVRSANSYQDRAATRRHTVGSDLPELSYPDAPPSSVHRALPEDSVGHRMLQKLGWKKGQGLGKESRGITEPIKADVKVERSGLGSGAGGGKRSLDAVGSESTAKHRRLVQHYSQAVAREARTAKH